MVLTLQNGYGNDEDILPYVKERNLLIGTAAGGATMLGPSYVFQGGIDATNIGTRPGCSLESARKVVEEFNACGLPSHVYENAMEFVWKKLLVNVGCSGVCALLEKNNAFMDFSRNAYAVGLELIKEAGAVAAAEG
jgi:2-dehydropantoate 2-reductase